MALRHVRMRAQAAFQLVPAGIPEERVERIDGHPAHFCGKFGRKL